MYEWLPPEVELMTDVAAADWVVARLRPWPTQGGVRVASFMPDRFEAYARVLHPEPLEGSLPKITLTDLVGFLESWTALEEQVWFGLWEGNGTWWKGAHGVLTSGPVEDVARNWRIDDERDEVLRATTTFGTSQRRYFLVRGYLRSASGLYAAAGENSANLWWPEGRSWLVSTEVDGFSTHVGGSRELVDALVSSETIEALTASLEDPIDPGPHPWAPG